MKREKHKYLLFCLDWVILLAAYILALKVYSEFHLKVYPSVHTTIFTAEFPYVRPEVLWFVPYTGSSW